MFSSTLMNGFLDWSEVMGNPFTIISFSTNLSAQFQIQALSGRWRAGPGVSTTLRPLTASTTTSPADVRTLCCGTARKPPRPASSSRLVQTQRNKSSRLQAAQKVSVWRLLPVEERLDLVASCSWTHSPFWLLRGSVSAWGKDLLWRLAKAIWLLESITIKYCNYPLCLGSICNRPGLCSPEKAADTVSVYGKTKPNRDTKHEKIQMNYDYQLCIDTNINYIKRI